MGGRWRRVRYRLWAPVYDAVAWWFTPARRRSIDALALRPGMRLLIDGAGTGLDLPLVPAGVSVLATDLTPAMLARARPRLRAGMQAAVMDAQRLALPDAWFDAVLLHLVLSVVPEPADCLREAARVVKPGGAIAIADKFVPDGQAPSAIRRLANVILEPLATDLTRRLGDILHRSGAPLSVESDEPAFGGAYRLVRLRRTSASPPPGLRPDPEAPIQELTPGTPGR